ncbi:hypothetical protein MMC07_002024 [Pseudocyphellaria aurata]|nr:hypothetical protein [Pseudocyphellaria aurata]
MLSKNLVLLASAGLILAQRPDNTSICDYYTNALLDENNSTNQYTLLTLVVNTALIGNYTKPNVGIMVPGILAPGTYNDTDINLLPYFNGALKSSNRGGDIGVAINFLDDGGAVPLMMNKPSNGTESQQYKLLTHLYEYFGVLLGCSLVGTPGYPAYSGQNSQGRVHKFMNLNEYELGYFITQVGLSAASFGVSTEDVTAVGHALAKLFAYRCAPETVVVPSQGPHLQSICQADTCPLSPNDTCSAYPSSIEPAVANATLAGGEGSNSTSSSNHSSTTTRAMKAPTSTSSVIPASANIGSEGMAFSFAVLGAATFALVTLL